MYLSNIHHKIDTSKCIKSNRKIAALVIAKENRIMLKEIFALKSKV